MMFCGVVGDFIMSMSSFVVIDDVGRGPASEISTDLRALEKRRRVIYL